MVTSTTTNVPWSDRLEYNLPEIVYEEYMSPMMPQPRVVQCVAVHATQYDCITRFVQ